MIKCIISKNKDSSGKFERKVPLKNPKDLTVEISSFVYNDFNPENDDYEEVEIRVKKSKVKSKFIESKGSLLIKMDEAVIEFEIDDDEQKDRFLDKDWSSESITPTLLVKGKNSKDQEYIDYQDNGLYKLAIKY